MFVITKPILLVLLLFPLFIYAQDNDYVRVDRITIKSKVLDEDRLIHIQYPKPNSENQAMAYPVLYLLDGESLSISFHNNVPT